MKLSLSKESFHNQEGQLIEYNAYVCHGVISQQIFKVYVKPYDLTGKQLLKTYFESGEVIVKDYLTKEGISYTKAFFEVNGMSVPVIISEEGRFIIKLYNYLVAQSQNQEEKKK